MATSEAIPLSKALGAQVRRYREIQEMSQEHLASVLRAYRLNWSRSTVGKAERGERDFTLQEVAILAWVLGCGGRALFGPPGSWLQLSGGAVIAPEMLARLFEPDWMEAEPWQIAPALDTLVEVGMIRHEAAQRAALSLGISPEVLDEAARGRYQRAFVEERDHRVERLRAADDPRSDRALRGQASGELIEELREQFRTKKAKKAKEARASATRRKR
jgi:transcriptional regulator with XRE-family HTH domain